MYIYIYIKFINLYLTAQSGLVVPFYPTRIDPLKGGSMILRKPLFRRDKGDTLSLLIQFLLKPWVIGVYVCVCACVFIKLHITTQSGPVILVILCHSH